MRSLFSCIKNFVVLYAGLQNGRVEWRDSTPFRTKVEDTREAGVGISINSDLDSILRVIPLVSQEITCNLASHEADKSLSVPWCKGVGQCWGGLPPHDRCRNLCNIVMVGGEEGQWRGRRTGTCIISIRVDLYLSGGRGSWRRVSHVLSSKQR